MYCISCGAQMKDGARFCPECGAPVEVAPQAYGQVSQQPVSYPAVLDNPDPVTYSAPEPDPLPVTYANPEPQPTYQQAPVSTANMPSLTTATVLVVIGFLLGIIWGIYGDTQRSTLKTAIETGNVEVANKKFRNIVIATSVGVAVNIFATIGALAQRGVI